MTNRITIKVDYENNAETWWDAARARAVTEPQFAGVFAALAGTPGEWSGTAEDCAAFLSVAETLPGWHEGDERAPHPLVVCEDATRITIEPSKMGGVPCIRGFRIPVATVTRLTGGCTPTEILELYPDLESEDLAAVCDYERKQYLACFGTLDEACEYESRVLSIGAEFLPPYAVHVRDGGEPVAAYWAWLRHQGDEGEGG